MESIAGTPPRIARVRRTVAQVCPICGATFQAAVSEVKRATARGRAAMFCGRRCGALAGNRQRPDNKIGLMVTANWLQDAYADTYRKAKQHAERRRSGRGIPFVLTKEEFNRMIERAAHACELTQIPFQDTVVPRYARRPWTPSLDRIESAGPYSFVNCRLVCSAVNIAMNSWGETTLRRIAHALINP